MTVEEFVALLERVPRTYPAFVDWIVADAVEFGVMDELAGFIESNPDATAEDVAEYSAVLTGDD